MLKLTSDEACGSWQPDALLACNVHVKKEPRIFIVFAVYLSRPKNINNNVRSRKIKTG